MEGHPGARHRRHRHLEQAIAVEPPGEWHVGPGGVAQGPEEGLPLAPLLRGQVAALEEIRPAHRVEQVGEDGGVVGIAHAGQFLEHRSGQAEPRAPEAARLRAGRLGDGGVRPAEIGAERGPVVEVQPWLVQVAVAADVVAGGGDRLQVLAVRGASASVPTTKNVMVRPRSASSERILGTTTSK